MKAKPTSKLPGADKERVKARSQQRMVGPIPREELKRAMMKDFEQRCIDSLTPDRGYGFPMDNVEALVSKYWPNDQDQP